MEPINYGELSDEKLLEEKKRLKKSKTFFAFYIGFLAGTALFGFGAWLLNDERQLGFLLPLLIPLAIIYKLVKNRKSSKALEIVLKERGI
jgi:hypothetical protein